MGEVGALPGASFLAQATHDKAFGICGCDVELGSMRDTLVGCLELVGASCWCILWQHSVSVVLLHCYLRQHTHDGRGYGPRQRSLVRTYPHHLVPQRTSYQSNSSQRLDWIVSMSVCHWIPVVMLLDQAVHVEPQEYAGKRVVEGGVMICDVTHHDFCFEFRGM